MKNTWGSEATTAPLKKMEGKRYASPLPLPWLPRRMLYTHCAPLLPQYGLPMRQCRRNIWIVKPNDSNQVTPRTSQRF